MILKCIVRTNNGIDGNFISYLYKEKLFIVSDIKNIDIGDDYISLTNSSFATIEKCISISTRKRRKLFKIDLELYTLTNHVKNNKRQ